MSREVLSRSIHKDRLHDLLYDYNPAPADEVSITEVTGPNEEDARYHVNLEKRTCGCTYWQSIGIACKHAVAVWEMYQSQLKATGEEISQARYNMRRIRRLVTGTTKCGICQQLGHSKRTCDYYESWFDWDNSDHRPFQRVFRESL